MQAWPWNKTNQRGSAQGCQRRTHRYCGESVRCALGEIADISSSGMRVRCEGKPPVKMGGVFPIRLKFDGGSIQLRAQVRWCKRRGLKQHEVGLQFIQMKPGMEHVLESIARFGMAAAAKHMQERRDEECHEGRQKGYQEGQQERQQTGQQAGAQEQWQACSDEGRGQRGPGPQRQQKKHQQTQRRVQVVAHLPNYYRVLELTPQATLAEIKTSYRRLAMRHHPDRSDAPDATKRFEAIHEAYQVLSDAARREAYSRLAG